VGGRIEERAKAHRPQRGAGAGRCRAMSENCLSRGNNGHVLAFDNLSGLPPWLSDTLCRLTSGGAFSTRRLSTDEDEILFALPDPSFSMGSKLSSINRLKSSLINTPPLDAFHRVAVIVFPPSGDSRVERA
jgi:hypothetical protein